MNPMNIAGLGGVVDVPWGVFVEFVGLFTRTSTTESKGTTVKNRFITTIIIAMIAGLMGCGGGASKSTAPTTTPTPTPTETTLQVSPASFDETVLLGTEQRIAEISLANNSESEDDFSITTTADWISLSATSGTIAPNESANVTLTFTCTAVDSLVGLLRISGENPDEVIQVPVTLNCEAPPVELEIVQPPPGARVLVDESAEAKFSWRFTSPWSGQEAVDYEVSSNLDGLTISATNGVAEPATDVEHDLQYSCTSNGLETATLTVAAGGESITRNWDILCTAIGPASTEIRVYQGILAVQVFANTTDEDELEYKVVQSAPLVDGRATYVSAVLGHRDPTPPEVEVAVPGKTETVLDDRIDVTTTRSENASIDFWTTEYVFDMPTELLDRDTPFEVRIDPNDLVVDENEDHNNHRVDYMDSGIAFAPESYDTVEIVVVPIIGNNPAPEQTEDMEVYAIMKDLLPFADYKIRMAATLDLSQGTWDIGNALRKVNEMRLVNGDSGRLYHGLFVHDEADGPCAASYLEGSVSVSAVPSQACRSTTFAHEIGHIVGLGHAPGCGAQDPDEFYPYPDGGIGDEIGWVISSRERIPDGTSNFHDLMGDCEDSFVSKYHYSRALEHWSDRSNFEPAKTPVPPKSDEDIIGTPSPGGLLLLGEVDQAGTWSIQTTKRVRPSIFDEYGPASSYRLNVVNSAIGQLLHSAPLTVLEVTHLPKRHWYAVIPIPSEGKVGITIHDERNNIVFEHALEFDRRVLEAEGVEGE